MKQARTTSRLAALLLCVGALACRPGSSPPAAPGSSEAWDGTVETAGGVTTVINRSGSLWGGPARLVEEASIGAADGEEPYLFGRIAALWANDDGILVLDRQVPALRVYDRGGEHVGDLGRAGQGPGEFERPDAMLVHPDGRIFLRDVARQAFLVWGPEGEPLARWPIGRFELLRSRADLVAMTIDGELWMPGPRHADRERMQEPGVAVRRYGPEGVLETREVPLPEARPREPGTPPRPYAPRPQWMMSPTGDLVTGLPDEYRFTIHHPDGTRTVVERRAQPVPIPPEEQEWIVAERIRSRRARDPDFDWDPEPIEFKPHYVMFLPDRSGRIWVLRRGPSERVEDCDADPLDVPEGRTPRPCWITTLTADVFAPDGRFLGAVENFADGNWTADPWFVLDKQAFIDGATALLTVVDEAGTIRVERYRLELPEDAG